MNKVTLKFKSRMENESFARICTCAFLSPLNPTFEELMEIKTIVSEAVTNAIIHGYDSNPNKTVKLEIAYDI
ncbi:MAG: ATP-binding protein, partial [Traorella sp.]